MLALGGLLAAVATPTPTPTPTVDPELVTPGPWGFIAIALVALAVIVLIWDRLRRIRRAGYREEVATQLDAAQAALAEAEGAVEATETDDDSVTSEDDDPDERPS